MGDEQVVSRQRRKRNVALVIHVLTDETELVRPERGSEWRIDEERLAKERLSEKTYGMGGFPG